MWSVSGVFLEFLWLDLASVLIDFDAVLVARFRSTREPFAMDKFTIQQGFRDAIFLHAEDMPHPSELDLDEDGADAGSNQQITTPLYYSGFPFHGRHGKPYFLCCVAKATGVCCCARISWLSGN